jgi:DNA helicase-2/ATP-dependent DNA helicase PcrA
METAHIKDVVAHVRAATNPNDIVSITRMLLLVEGIGPKAAQQIGAGFGGDTPASRVLESFFDDRRIGPGAARLSRTLAFLEREGIHPVEAVEQVIEYISPILMKKYDDHPKRLQDLEHLAIISHKYATLEEFLTDMALEPPSDSISDITPEDPDPERLILSTVHSAKGLEWHSVFVIWAAEGYFPTTYSAESAAELEEELRLMYVAVTRAKENLAITYPVKIMTHRGPTFARPSRFINDIDTDILEPWVVDEEWD